LQILLLDAAVDGYHWTITAVIGMLLVLVGHRLILSRRKIISSIREYNNEH